MKCRMFALSLALGALLCLAPSAAAQPAAPAVPTLPQTGTTGWMAGVLASLGSLLLACGWFFTRKSKHS